MSHDEQESTRTATRMFHPFSARSSNVSTNRLEDYIRQDVSGVTITGIPGIGPSTARKLRAYGITNEIQLLGSLQLQYDGSSFSSQDYADQIKLWLQDDVGCTANTHTIVRALLLKLSTLFPTLAGDLDLCCVLEDENETLGTEEGEEEQTTTDDDDDEEGDVPHDERVASDTSPDETRSMDPQEQAVRYSRRQLNQLLQRRKQQGHNE